MKGTIQYIEQSAQVIEVSAGKLTAQIMGNSGCASCHHSLCMLGESKAKEFQVTAKTGIYKVGDQVLIRINSSSAYLGLALLYILPFLLLFGLLIGLLQIGYTESVAGVLSLLSLLPYFTLVYLLRKQLAMTCQASVLKKV